MAVPKYFPNNPNVFVISMKVSIVFFIQFAIFLGIDRIIDIMHEHLCSNCLVLIPFQQRNRRVPLLHFRRCRSLYSLLCFHWLLWGVAPHYCCVEVKLLDSMWSMWHPVSISRWWWKSWLSIGFFWYHPSREGEGDLISVGWECKFTLPRWCLLLLWYRGSCYQLTVNS